MDHGQKHEKIYFKEYILHLDLIQEQENLDDLDLVHTVTRNNSRQYKQKYQTTPSTLK